MQWLLGFFQKIVARFVYVNTCLQGIFRSCKLIFISILLIDSVLFYIRIYFIQIKTQQSKLWCYYLFTYWTYLKLYFSALTLYLYFHQSCYICFQAEFLYTYSTSLFPPVLLYLFR